jgi:two-component system NtrC family sensor kinase
MNPLNKKIFDRAKSGDKGELDPGYSDSPQFQKYFNQLRDLAMIGKITPEVIHDINNQLTGILGYAELLSMKKIEDESIKNGLKNITFSAEKCKDLLANILDLSRQGISPVHLGDVNEIVEKTIELRKCALRHRQIEIIRELKTKIPTISVDVIKLQKILLNLIFKTEETLEFRPEGKKLIFKTSVTSQKPTGVIITISANGFGMSPDRLAHILDLLPGAESEVPGKAIRLNDTQQWIDDLGGTLKIDSSEGEGPVFMIYLPVKGKG